MALGAQLRQHRRRRGLSQEELAGLTGLSVRSIRNLEADRVAVPRPATLRLLAEALGVADLRPAETSSPEQLPRPVAGFTGRADLLARLDELAGALPVVSGPGGVGKTTLAVHWAHRAADRFPDGRLYVNLQGWGPDESAVAAGEALAGFLRALDVPLADLPATVEGRAALFRGRTAGRRLLVVLDNARDAEQVRPLLPGSGATALITSRDRLAGLVATEGATPVPVDVLPAADAVRLLAERLGAGRVAAERDAVDEIVARCDRLPLALAVVAARAAVDPGLSLSVLAEQLRQPAGALDALTAGDEVTDLRRVLSWSYRSLTPAARQVFQVLGLHPGPDLDLVAAANLAGRPLAGTRRALAELGRLHLIQPRPELRFTMHDLLRAYAAETAAAELSEDARRAAGQRLRDFYVHTLVGLRALLIPRWRAPLPVREPLHAAAPADQLGWVDAERVNLVAVAVQAAGAGDPDTVRTMVLCLGSYLHERGHTGDSLAMAEAGVRSARAGGDGIAEADALTNVAGAYLTLGRYDETIAHGERALELYRSAGAPPTKLARGLKNLVELYAMVGDVDRARRYGEESLRIARAELTDKFVADALLQLGVLLANLGRLDEALAHTTEALQIFEAGDLPRDVAEARLFVGQVRLRRGEYDEARPSLLGAQAFYRSGGMTGRGLGATLILLGRLSREVRERKAAGRYLADGLRIARTLDDPELQADALSELALLAHDHHRPEAGLTDARAALALATGAGLPRLEARARNVLGLLLTAVGDAAGAHAEFRAALAIATRLGDPYERGLARIGLAPATGQSAG